MNAACLLLLAVAPAAPPALPAEALVLPPVGRGGRVVVGTDAIADSLAAGKWIPPKPGDSVRLPGGAERRWEAAPVKDGATTHRALAGGYAFVPVESDAEQVAILEAAGHLAVLVNGESRVGDFYETGYVRIPVRLRKGTNEFLFHVARGRLRLALAAPKADALLNPGDLTAFDPEAGKDFDGLVALPVLNATSDTAAGLVMESTVGNAPAVRTPVPPVVPTGVRKVGFAVRGRAPEKPGPVPVRVRLLRGDAVLDEATVNLEAQAATAARRHTFRSGIDGSVQYFAAIPPKEGPADGAGLVLTLHGASVEAIGQARAYAAKPGLWLVAPTNRRPFGFDWEDWGRLDAQEVLEHVTERWKADRRRTFLTGHSMGGHGTWHLGVTFPGRFAAVAPSAGWVSMWSYAGAVRPEDAAGVDELILRASNPSDTVALAPNLAAGGVYVLHGDADDNVPVAQARAMRQVLGGFHPDFAYHEQPGAGHWWGNECVDFPPLFDFLARHELPRPADVRSVAFRTASPAVSSRSHWLTLAQQEKAYRPSRAEVRIDPEKRTAAGTTENVARLALDLSHWPGEKPFAIELDGQKVEARGPTAWLARRAGKWELAGSPGAGEKGPARSGPFREAFRNRVVFVYGTKGSAEENAWSLAKARFDAEQFWYRGNGSVDVVADADFDPSRERDRNVVVYGHADANAAWKPLLADSPVRVTRGEVAVGERREKGDGFACLFARPRPGSPTALVGVVAGTGLPGLRRMDRLPYFVSGVGYPDWLVLGPEALSAGLAGVRGAGWFGNDWSLATGETAWRE
jgi:poly(3-hydroxybutyrate) depolymerase